MDLRPPDEDQKRSDTERCQAAATAGCEHVYATRIRGGEPICIPSCMLCDELGWDDIREQAEKIRAEAYRAGQEIAARAIQRHADEFAPSGGNIQQRRMRRHLLIAARVARPTPTVEQIADAVRRGDYAACYLDEAGKPVSEKG